MLGAAYVRLLAYANDPGIVIASLPSFTELNAQHSTLLGCQALTAVAAGEMAHVEARLSVSDVVHGVSCVACTTAVTQLHALKAFAASGFAVVVGGCMYHWAVLPMCG
jgi:hypothetical protein